MFIPAAAIAKALQQKMLKLKRAMPQVTGDEEDLRILLTQHGFLIAHTLEESVDEQLRKSGFGQIKKGDSDIDSEWTEWPLEAS